jgi:hypothetical protein
VAGADGPPMTAQKAPKRQGGVSECHQAGESGATALFGASRDESKAASEGRLVCHIGGWRPMAKTDGLNARLHWAVRAKRTTLVHDITTGAMTLAGWPAWRAVRVRHYVHGDVQAATPARLGQPCRLDEGDEGFRGEVAERARRYVRADVDVPSRARARGQHADRCGAAMMAVDPGGIVFAAVLTIVIVGLVFSWTVCELWRRGNR